MTNVKAMRTEKTSASVTVFGLSDWLRWLDDGARSMFGISGQEFERAYLSGMLNDSPEAGDLASALHLIERLRERDKLDKKA
jgi:hypothetical protein